MEAIVAGEIGFEVEHRNPAPGGGPTLRVRDLVRNREVFRFDCFDEGPHWHLCLEEGDEITRISVGDDPIDCALRLLREDLDLLLKRAAPELNPPDREDFAGVLASLEPRLRNPPMDLESVRADQRRPSVGEKWGHYSEDVLPLWVADMDFPIAEPIRRVLRRVVERSDLGYPIHPGPTGVRELAAARMGTRFGWEVQPSQVEVITDVVQGMYVALLGSTQAGEGVVVQTPVYPPFLGCVEDTGRRLVEAPLVSGASGTEVDLDALREAVDVGTTALLLCNPQNPSGRVFRREELEGIAEIALERDLVVVSDEIHADLVYRGYQHVPIASLGPEIAARTLTLTSASKAFNIAGLRCAVAIFGSRKLQKQFNSLPRHELGGIGVPGIEAMMAAWRFAQPWLDDVLVHLESNRDYLLSRLRADFPAVIVHPPEATYLAWLDCRALEIEGTPYEFFLRRAKVALSDGRNFGPPGRGFARINFATSKEILAEALDRMAEALG